MRKVALCEIRETDISQATKTTETSGTTTVPVYTTLTVVSRLSRRNSNEGSNIFVQTTVTTTCPVTLTTYTSASSTVTVPITETLTTTATYTTVVPVTVPIYTTLTVVSQSSSRYQVVILIIVLDHRNNYVPGDLDNLHKRILCSHSPYYKNSDNKRYLHNRSPCHRTDLHDLDDSKSALARTANQILMVFLSQTTETTTCPVTLTTYTSASSIITVPITKTLTTSSVYTTVVPVTSTSVTTVPTTVPTTETIATETSTMPVYTTSVSVSSPSLFLIFTSGHLLAPAV